MGIFVDNSKTAYDYGGMEGLEGGLWEMLVLELVLILLLLLIITIIVLFFILFELYPLIILLL